MLKVVLLPKKAIPPNKTVSFCAKKVKPRSNAGLFLSEHDFQDYRMFRIFISLKFFAKFRSIPGANVKP